MKIVTYNVNGLRPRIAQFGSLRKLLDSFDADIICFQETKLRRQELTADLVMADGYESFFSCTRTSEKGRAGYSGVATFCRVNSAFSSKEVALPVVAEEGITGLLDNSQIRSGEKLILKEGLEDYSVDELMKVDGEGRCVVTDHSHFVLFNIYGPRAVCDDTERIQYKHCFFKVLEKRLELLLSEGRRVFVVGDFNIAPTAIDRCDAEPDFEKNEFRKWFRSMLVENGGAFYDVFRAKHPERRDAYTCWPQNTGAEIFNYGSRIDHIITARSCLHQEHDQQGHNFLTCHVEECDILTRYSRWQPGSKHSHKWKGGRNTKLEGSDHAPVFMSLVEVPDVPQHNTPSLSSRYLPAVRGVQQTILSVLMKRQVSSTPVEPSEVSNPILNESIASCCENMDRASGSPCGISGYSNSEFKSGISETDEQSKATIEALPNTTLKQVSEHNKLESSVNKRKKARKGQLSQLSLKSFFSRDSDAGKCSEESKAGVLPAKTEDQKSNHSCECLVAGESRSVTQDELCTSVSPGDEEKMNICSLDKGKSNVALMEWQRIQQIMQNSIPLCKGHKEPCVARVVKKPGPNYGRRFYVCARAEGPSSNPEANCNFFRWAASKYGQK